MLKVYYTNVKTMLNKEIILRIRLDSTFYLNNHEVSIYFVLELNDKKCTVFLFVKTITK